MRLKSNDMSIKTLKEIPAGIPILIAGWPGMGNVGIGAADYLRRKLGGEACARLNVTRYFFPESIEVEKGIGRIPAPPFHNIYLIKKPPLFVFEGETQVGGEAGVKVADELLDFAQMHGVKAVYTGAAFAMPMSYKEPVRIFGVATDNRLKEIFSSYLVEPLNQGRIAGLNGLLLGLAGTRGLPAACFLATMPHYAVQTPNPKASKAIVHVFEQILNVTVDMTEINEAIKRTDRLLGEFESRVNAALQNLKQQAAAGDEQAEAEEQPEPHEIMAHIEKLFEVAEHDRSKAGLLKQELDHWGLFKLYEDRFLDLFDKKKNRK